MPKKPETMSYEQHLDEVTTQITGDLYRRG